MSGRYQSKLFNFLSRQSMQIHHKSAKTLRQLKVAAVWGVQMLLYPVYVAFQATRLAERQLQQAVRQGIPRLRAAARSLQAAPPLPVDAPIQSLLQQLSQLEVHLPSAPNSELALALTHSAQQPHRIHSAEVLVATAGLTSSLQVRGLASMLGTGSLVLVAANNQVLDILTPVQQSDLTRRLTWELASYWRQQKRLAAPQAQPLSTYLPLPKPQQNALPPIRAWRGLMAWMQRSSVAVSTDLFQESQLSLWYPVLPSDPAQPLRSAQPSWEAAEAQFYDWLSQTGRSAGHLVIAGWQAGKTALDNRSLQAGIHQLRAESGAMLPAAEAVGLPVGLPQHAAPSDWLVTLDRWISEIPGLSAEPTLPEPLRSEHSAQLRAIQPRLSPPMHTGAMQATHRDIQPGIAQIPSSCPLYADALSEWDADHGMEHPHHYRQQIEAPLTSFDTANEEEAAMVPRSWIETEAELVEYIKHPLEQLLEWLDHGMLWAEQRLSKVWLWLNRPIL